jgi:serine/threonine protein kinase
VIYDPILPLYCSQSNYADSQQSRDSVLLRKSFNLLDAESRIKQFLTRERYLLWKLRHPNIVEFRHYEVDPSGTQGNLYMEFCKGGDLQRFVDPEDLQYVNSLGALNLPDCRLDWIDIWTIISDIAAALAYCHYGMLEEEQGSISLMLKWQPVLHRDIKAANSKCKFWSTTYGTRRPNQEQSFISDMNRDRSLPNFAIWALQGSLMECRAFPPPQQFNPR